MNNGGDLHVVDAMELYGGSFVKKLAAALKAADTNNAARIKGAFPDLWCKYKAIAETESPVDITIDAASDIGIVG